MHATLDFDPAVAAAQQVKDLIDRMEEAMRERAFHAEVELNGLTHDGVIAKALETFRLQHPMFEPRLKPCSQSGQNHYLAIVFVRP